MNNNMNLWFRRPAQAWEETLPIGNGRLGAMIFGGVEEEKLGLNEDTLWSGYPKDKNNYSAYPHLQSVREKLFAGKYLEAEEELRNSMEGEHSASYLPLGDLLVSFDTPGQAEGYTRCLNIDTAVATVKYTAGGVDFTREYFAGYPQKAILMRFSSSQPAGLSVRFTSQLMHLAFAFGDEIRISGKCPEHINQFADDQPILDQGTLGQEFTAKVRILSTNGTVTVQENSVLRVENATETVVALEAVAPAELSSSVNFEKEKAVHIADYRKIYDACELYLGEQPEVPTDERLQALKDGAEDPALFALYFAYGRYLLIACSRKGSQAANLQGIWSWQLKAPWSSNYTTNINTEMNYWPAISCNLLPCLEPYNSLLQKLRKTGRATARIHYRARGFTQHHNTDYWGVSNPMGIPRGWGEGRQGCVRWGMWPMGAAWLCEELYNEYVYTGDEDFLRDVAWPVTREAALFLLDWVVEHNGEYTTAPSTSPENAFVVPEDTQKVEVKAEQVYNFDATAQGDVLAEINKKLPERKTCAVATGSAMDLSIIRELWGNYAAMCAALGCEDDDVLAEINEKLPKLAPFKIGRYGQIVEFNEDFDEPEPGHRHISHLYGLFPSELFANDPKMQEACRKALEHRLANGGGHTGWSCAWIINVFAILGDAENAEKYLNVLLKRSSYPNLWDAHPPFQIDGIFGGIAGIANMLVQDRGGEVKYLPALPKSWKNGWVRGLRIKGGKTVDLAWEDGKLTNCEVKDSPAKI